jgi:hypothetical protein
VNERESERVCVYFCCGFVGRFLGGFWEVVFVFWFGNVRELVFVRVEVFLKREWGEKKKRDGGCGVQGNDAE